MATRAIRRGKNAYFEIYNEFKKDWELVRMYLFYKIFPEQHLLHDIIKKLRKLTFGDAFEYPTAELGYLTTRKISNTIGVIIVNGRQYDKLSDLCLWLCTETWLRYEEFATIALKMFDQGFIEENIPWYSDQWCTKTDFAKICRDDKEDQFQEKYNQIESDKVDTRMKTLNALICMRIKKHFEQFKGNSYRMNNFSRSLLPFFHRVLRKTTDKNRNQILDDVIYDFYLSHDATYHQCDDEHLKKEFGHLVF